MRRWTQSPRGIRIFASILDLSAQGVPLISKEKPDLLNERNSQSDASVSEAKQGETLARGSGCESGLPTQCVT